MGLFSDKYKTTVATSVARIIPDDDLPNSIRTGVFRSLLANDNQMIENAMDELIAGMGLRAHRYQAYGKNHYTYGLPQSSTFTSQTAREAIRAIIETDLGGPIIIEQYRFGAFNNLHFGWQQLQDNYGYNTVTNELEDQSLIEGFPVYLSNMIVVIAEATLSELNNGSLLQYGVPPRAGPSPDRPAQTWAMGLLRTFVPFETDDTVVSDYLRVEYCWLDALGVLQTGSFDITVAGMDDTKSYHQMSYTFSGIRKYWTYQDDEGTYPAIDNLSKPSYLNSGHYFPWLYYRYEGIDQTIDEEAVGYVTSVKASKKIGMDFNDIAAKINENPEIEGVEQAMLVMAVPAETTNQLEMRYLFDYFKEAYVNTGGVLRPRINPPEGFGVMNPIGRSDNGDSTDGIIFIQDARFKMGLGFRYIFVEKFAGNIGAVGTYSTGSGVENIEEIGTDRFGNPIVFDSSVNYRYYRKQLTATVYEQVYIVNLRMVYFIEGEYKVTARDADNILLIPLDRRLTKLYSLPDREVLYCRSMHFVFNSMITVTLSWYETEAFIVLVRVIAVVLFIYSLGETWELLMAALALGTAAALINVFINILIEILWNKLIAYLFGLFVKAIGIKNAFIVAVVMIIGAMVSKGSTNINGVWADALLAAASGLIKAADAAVVKLNEELLAEVQEYSTFVDKEKERLKVAQKLLENDNKLIPLIIFGETPNDYFERTIHYGNIGTISIDAVSEYVATALALPTIEKTLEEDSNGDIRSDGWIWPG